MNHNDLHLFLYERVKEIQPHLLMLVQNYKEMGMNEIEINKEICFALIHEGYKLRCLEEGFKIKPFQRQLQTKVDVKTDDEK